MMFRIRPITRDDDIAIANVIRTVMPEFGASGPGFAIHDAEVDAMSDAYSNAGCAYFVIEVDSKVCGGGGIAPLAGADDGTCELRKMYFLPELRGQGAGVRLMTQCLDTARALGHRRCYIETLTGMDVAQHVYEKFGFARLPAPLGKTGHFSCNRFYLREL